MIELTVMPLPAPVMPNIHPCGLLSLSGSIRMASFDTRSTPSMSERLGSSVMFCELNGIIVAASADVSDRKFFGR